MAIRTTRSAGMLLLAFWLILTGIDSFVALSIPGVLTAALVIVPLDGWRSARIRAAQPAP